MGRRIAHSRIDAGISRAALARVVGADPAYLRYIEEEDASPSTAVLLRLASALGVSLGDLRGTTVEYPAGRGRATAAPKLTSLSPAECRKRLADHGVGRVGVTGPTGPLILPVNYSVVNGEIAFRADEQAELARVAGRDVAFEVDRIDESMSSGWDVLVVGRARRITDVVEITELDKSAFSKPWPDPRRRTWMVIHPRTVTGRRIRT
ncbi:DNA-binding protein [Streptomyces tsukubensis]|uniref:DNA-binding protein n=1 Tax=Streptomyces tsukubensis TaxID=83656 RepID=A0A1V4AH19_9ACTN|nr:DNA-binding protein [Streptomyces tsukubensis]